MKKLFAAVLTFAMLVLCISPVYALDIASAYTYLEQVQVQPGNPRSDKPVYEFSWLDNVIIRYDANAVTSAPVTPIPSDYLYSETYEEFVEEVNNYKLLFELDENTVGEAYRDIIDALSYTFVAMGFTDKQDVMREYLDEEGIKLPVNESVEDKAAIAVIYAALKYDAIYVLYEKEVEFPVGVTLDEATVIVLSALTGTMLPSGIDSLTGFAVLVMESYVEQFDQLPVSDNPDASEIFHWVKVITAAENEYQVPLEAYDKATTAQKEYVDYAYYASILNTLYDINVDPIKLVVAMQSEEEDSLQKFVLKEMLDEKEISYDEKSSAHELFDLACENGFFALEQELYADIFLYELRVPSICEKVWFTPFCLAGQLNGSDASYVKIYLNGEELAPGSTESTPLDKEKDEEYVELRVVYDDGGFNNSETVYTYKVIKDESLNKEVEELEDGDVVGEVQQFIDTIVPDENTSASQKVDDVFSAIDSAVTQAVSDIDENLLSTYESSTTNVSELLSEYEITTEASSKQTQASEGAVETTTAPRFDSEYLGELISDVYVTDANGNIVTTQALSSVEEEEETTEGIIDKVAETVKESPEVVAVPSTLLTALTFAGYFMSKKHRDVDAYAEREEKDGI